MLHVLCSSFLALSREHYTTVIDSAQCGCSAAHKSQPTYHVFASSPSVSASGSCLHSGQERLRCRCVRISQRSTHRLWKQCAHGNQRITSPAANASRHRVHAWTSAGSSPPWPLRPPPRASSHRASVDGRGTHRVVGRARRAATACSSRASRRTRVRPPCAARVAWGESICAGAGAAAATPSGLLGSQLRSARAGEKEEEEEVECIIAVDDSS
jgi:hypothetical protein